MHPRQSCPPELAALASAQAMVLTREQALAHGLSRHAWQRLVRLGHWRRIVDGVVLTHPLQPDWPALAWAGVLIGGDAARLGGAAAAHLHGLLDLPPVPLRVLVPAASPRGRPGPWEFVRERPGARSVRSVGAPARTVIEDTVLDLVQDGSESEVIDVVTRAIQRRLTSPGRLAMAAADRRRLRHRRLLTVLLDDVAQGVDSPLELEYLRHVERAHGLPKARRQVMRRRYRSDVSYDQYQVLVELDGRLGHTGEGRFRDMWRDNQFVVDGRTTLRYGWRDVHGSACQVAHQVGTVLQARGWTGVVQRCARCRRVTEQDLAS